MGLYMAWTQSVERYPNNPALSLAGQELTYQMANETITQLAEILRDNEPSKNGFMIYCQKSFYSILWQLAANKAGQAFINVDIVTPKQRVDYLLSLTEPQWIFSDQIRDFPGYSPLLNIEGFTLWKRINLSYLIHNLELEHRENITHIYFSSGSTGMPKAILLNDQAIVSVVKQQAQLIGMTSQSKFAWLLSPAFDASLSDIYTTLLSGACLYICDFPMTKIKTLTKFFNNHGITHTDLSPSILSILQPTTLPTIQSVIFGGEVANEKTIFQWLASEINMFNAYGPTETTICSSLKKVDKEWQSNNIGKPLSGVQYSIELPIGELLISGQHLAIGYTNQTLNKSKFIEEDGVRYYKTGDLVKTNSEGDYIFMGRADRQIKVHGILICPEEIENYALQGGCSEALCKLEDKLTLYYSGPVDLNNLKNRLQQLLPSSMVPQKWLHMETLTKNINGKIQL